MAKKPADDQPEPKRKTEILGAYRLEGGGFAAYSGEGRTKVISQTEAEAIGVRC
jgi:hypothetical protein